MRILPSESALVLPTCSAVKRSHATRVLMAAMVARSHAHSRYGVERLTLFACRRGFIWLQMLQARVERVHRVGVVSVMHSLGGNECIRLVKHCCGCVHDRHQVNVCEPLPAQHSMTSVTSRQNERGGARDSCKWLDIDTVDVNA